MKGKITKSLRQETQRLRWRRNKRAERQRVRKREAEVTEAMAEGSLDPKFVEQVWTERDKRRKNFPWKMPSIRDDVDKRPKYFPNSSNFASQDLVCDVWAAEVILGELHPAARITHAKIAKFLFNEGRAHGVKLTSLATKVGRVRSVVRFLEQSRIWNRGGAYWPKFPESVHEHGSGVKQHVDKVMAYLEFLRSRQMNKE